MSMLAHRGIDKNFKIKGGNAMDENEPRRLETKNRKVFPVSLTEEQLRQIFWHFDKNQDGDLCKEELREAFKNLGAYFPRWRAARAISAADENGDGVISEAEFEELVKYALKCNYKIY